MTHPNPSTSPHRRHSNNGSLAVAADETRAVIFAGPRSTDHYNFARMFSEWAWFTGHRRKWSDAVRILAGTLRGLEGAGLIARRRIPRPNGEVLHCFELTDLGHEAVAALSGRWAEENRR
jgi:hypothetical protein